MQRPQPTPDERPRTTPRFGLVNAPRTFDPSNTFETPTAFDEDPWTASD
jgi:hypothetical protein